METEATSDEQAAAHRPNLAAVAKLAGVSVSTASIAFSGSGPVSETTRARVLAAAAELAYAGPDPRAQSLRRGRSGIIGVVIEDRLSDAFRDPMNIAMLDGIADETGATGSGLLLLTRNGTGAAAVDTAPVDAVILIGCSTNLAASVAIFRRRGIALVAVEAEPMDAVLPIDLDNREASRSLALELQRLAHKRVAVVTLPLDGDRTDTALTPDREAAGTGYTASERLRGVREVFPDAGGFVTSGSSLDEGERAAAALLDTGADRPTAIIAQSDVLAAGVIHAAERMGLRVPGDLSVVGFDGVRRDAIGTGGLGEHDLTTMVQPAVEKGRAAGRAVIALLAGEHPEPQSFTSEFHRGNTISKAPPFVFAAHK